MRMKYAVLRAYLTTITMWSASTHDYHRHTAHT
jgi:hypothetical protein